MGRIVKTAKTKFSIGAVSDDDMTLAKFKADTTYIPIDGLTNLGSYGASRQLITSDHVGSGVTKKAKGSTNYGSMNIAADYQPNDPGQIAVEAAVESDDPFNIKVERPIGKGKWRVDYFPAHVMSNSNELGGSNDAQKLQITFELDGKPQTEMPA